MITQTLVRNCLNTTFSDIPESVVAHAKNGILNWMGVAIGASHHPAVCMALGLKEDLGSNGQASIFGRPEKVDILLAALINGTSSHVFDYDDTHLDTIHHPSSPVAPVVFALGEWHDLPADALLRAYVLGCEAGLRIGEAVYPSHYHLGWHITGTAGTFGAAIAAGLLLDLDEEQMIFAMGIAGTQASGLREMFGTMTKSFHAGKAAQNGLLAALLAQKGFTSSKAILEANGGFANVLSTNHNLDKLNAGWGLDWELLRNSFKAYACGIVLHPSIDACIALGKKVDPDFVHELEIIVNPYVLELTGKIEPQTGLEGKFSIYHAAAIAFLDEDASEEQFSDEKVLDPKAVRLREKIKITVEEGKGKEEAVARLTLKNGSQLMHEVKHATGSVENPMSAEALANKFKKLTTSVIGADNAEAATEMVYRMDTLQDVRLLLAHCTPG